MPHCRLLVNRRAGSTGRRSSRRLVEEIAATTGAEIVLTDSAEGGARAARQAVQDGVPVVLAAGGDGTAQSVVSGLLAANRPREELPRLALVPIGRGNDLARACGYRPDAALIGALLSGGTGGALDVGRARVDGRTAVFVNGLGIGLDARAAERARRVPLGGIVAYALAAVVTLLRKDGPWTARGRADETSFDEPISVFALGNGPTTGGGFRFTPRARPDSGVLDYLVLGASGRAELFALLPRAIAGTHESHRKVRFGRLTRLSLELDPPAPIHADGEALSRGARRVEIEVVPGAVPLLLPGAPVSR